MCHELPPKFGGDVLQALDCDINFLQLLQNITLLCMSNSKIYFLGKPQTCNSPNYEPIGTISDMLSYVYLISCAPA